MVDARTLTTTVHLAVGGEVYAAVATVPAAGRLGPSLVPELALALDELEV